MRKWKIGLIGTGFWSEKHLEAWRRIEGAQIHALCDRDPDKLAAKAERYGVPEERRFGDLGSMLANADIDIVDIVTGPDTHVELVRQAAAAGKHILCQKPFARSEAEAREMVELARVAGVRLMVTENWRWLSCFRTIKRLLDEGSCGKLHAMRYIHSDYYTPRMQPGVPLPQPFFRDMPRLLFYEMGAHWFDTWRFLFGTPARLYAETATISPYVRGEDAGIVALGYDDGRYGYMDMSWATRQKLDGPLGEAVVPDHLERMVVDGEDGTIKLYADGAIGFVRRDGGESVVAEARPLDHEESHVRLQSHFIACLEEGRQFETSGEDNLVTLRMIFGTYESAVGHVPVYFKREESEPT